MLTVATLATLAWGALAFGAVYPWAYGPLLVACASIGVAGLLARRRPGRGSLNVALAFGLVVVVLAVLVQLVPLSAATVARLSPATDALLRQYDVAYAQGVTATAASGATAPRRLRHPLTINPSATGTGLACLVALGLLLLGAARALTDRDARTLVHGLIVLGVLLALVGIIQKATFTGKIYGLWEPLYGRAPFGPFVNRNHFAGWMLMALPLALGDFCARVARGMRGVKPGWRPRVVWFSSPEANQAILVGFAILVMGLALVMTLSRSGITSFALVLVLTGTALARRQPAATRRVVILSYLAFLALVATGWAGLDAIIARFGELEPSGFGGRLGAWADAWRIAGAFPLTGTGLNTYGAATLFYQTHELASHWSEAHNDYLQLAAEGGLLVGVPAVILLALFVREVRRRVREGARDTTMDWIRVGAVTGLLAIAFQEVMEFSLQMPGNAALFVILAAIAVRKA